MKVRTLTVKAMAFVFAMLLVSGLAFAAETLSTSLSPDGRMSAVWTKDHEVMVVDSSGAVLQKIGIHGAAPLFSQDRKSVV